MGKKGLCSLGQLKFLPRDMIIPWEKKGLKLFHRQLKFFFSGEKKGLSYSPWQLKLLLGDMIAPNKKRQFP